MVALYLGETPGGEDARRSLLRALRRLPTSGDLSWVDDPVDAWLTVRLVAGPELDYTLAIPAPPAVPKPTLRDHVAVLAAIQQAVLGHIVRIPGPHRRPAGVGVLVREGLTGLARALPAAPGGRWATATAGAVRVAADLVRHGELEAGEVAGPLVELVWKPLWDSGQRLRLEQAAWAALSDLPHPEVREILMRHPAAEAAGAYAASTHPSHRAFRRPQPAWLVPADTAVATFLQGAAGRAFRAAA